MSQATIFLSNASSRKFANFDNGPSSFVFRELTCRGVDGIVDGPVCFFVDWLLPECSGLELCRRLRADGRFDEAPITMILEKDDPEDRRRALRGGADSYIIAPVDRNAILDRVMLTDFGADVSVGRELIDAGRLQINLAAHRASWDGETIDLPPNELRLLRYFAENANRVLSREDIIVALGKGDDGSTSLRTVDVWIKRLRGGLREVGASDIVRTVQGRGYVLDL